MKQGKIYKYGAEGYLIVDKLIGEPVNGYQTGMFRMVWLKPNVLSVELVEKGSVHYSWIGRTITPKVLKKRITAHRKKITAWMKRGEIAALASADKCSKLFEKKRK